MLLSGHLQDSGSETKDLKISPLDIINKIWQHFLSETDLLSRKSCNTTLISFH